MVPLPGPAQQPRLLLLPAAPVPLPAAPRKRQRLAHLSPEEKALRRYHHHHPARLTGWRMRASLPRALPRE